MMRNHARLGQYKDNSINHRPEHSGTKTERETCLLFCCEAMVNMSTVEGVVEDLRDPLRTFWGLESVREW